ncbi:hypothetical protein BpHYR1_035695 [Brachionus plicatilis]|uniref:Uncharacterized protein n=1 Tax=Brachionus plicatilis TaxID=10195 RepID=A0A3M7QVI2_BRAPC|nr:hypothetical protein BpHYR1_035695 [Brachionus plicatilis]
MPQTGYTLINNNELHEFMMRIKSFFETEEKILKNLSEERSRINEMRAKLADYAFENFQTEGFMV